MVGVVLELTDTPPEGATIRDVSKLIDLVPALTPKLLELGPMDRGLLPAPIGEVFRAMMPPVTELTARREIVLTEAGRALADKLQQGATLTISAMTSRVPAKTPRKKRTWQVGPGGQLGISPRIATPAAARLCANQETLQGRQAEDATRGRVERARARKQRRWERKKSGCARCCKPNAARCFTATPEACADVRAVIERLLREGLLESWEEPLIPPKIRSMPATYRRRIR